ncbi:uncharacterized protein METZ01_LOCUS370007, partial [marine metagenome]
GKKEPKIKSNSYIEHLPIPDEIIAENIYAKQVYEDGNFKNVKLMDEIYRLDYLKNVDRNNILPQTVLVAAAMHDGKQLFSYLKDEMIKNREVKYYFKFHPKVKDVREKVIKLNKDNVISANQHLTHYLSFVSKVIVTQSSVGYEAYLLGIPVRVVSLPNKINDSPLLDMVSESNNKSITVDFI